ncbi:MAG: ComEC/Rec2 family competence protein [Candidatus Omnitrophota bacterium]
MKRPLVLFTVFYCSGILLGNLKRFNFWVIIGLALTILCCINIFLKKNRIFLILTSVLTIVAGILSLENYRRVPSSHINNFIGYKSNSLYCLKGFVDSDIETKNNYSEFIFRPEEMRLEKLGWGCCGKVLIRTDCLKDLNYGENLMLIGKLSRPNANVSGYKNYLMRQGIYLTMQIKDLRQVIRLTGKSGNPFLRFSRWLRNKSEAVISSNLEDIPASILSAMILGQRRNIPWLVNDSMVKTGTVHILVVSGFNVGIVAFISNLLLKILRIPRRPRLIFTIICLLIYCFVTGASNPVIRATIMGVIFLCSYFFKREPDIYISLSLAALIILIVNPQQLFDIGFQLSFASVLAIVFVYPRLKNLFGGIFSKIKILQFIYDSSLVSFSAWLGTSGIIMLNFRILSPITVLANILIVPLATLITLAGFTLVLSGAFCPFLTNLFSFPASMLINLLLVLNTKLAKLPFAYFSF